MAELGDAIMSGEEGESSVSYGPLPELEWLARDEKVSSYCYMCQRPKGGKYSNEYKCLEEILSRSMKGDFEAMCKWATSFYNTAIKPHTGKEMTPYQFARHVKYHVINPLQVQIDLVRKSSMMLDMYMKEATERRSDGKIRGVQGDRAKTLESMISVLGTQNRQLFAMQKNSSA